MAKPQIHVEFNSTAATKSPMSLKPNGNTFMILYTSIVVANLVSNREMGVTCTGERVDDGSNKLCLLGQTNSVLAYRYCLLPLLLFRA